MAAVTMCSDFEAQENKFFTVSLKKSISQEDFSKFTQLTCSFSDASHILVQIG